MPKPDVTVLRKTLDLLEEGVLVLNERREIVFMNSAAERITGVNRENAAGSRCDTVLGSERCTEDCLLDEARRTGNVVRTRHAEAVDAMGNRKLLSIAAGWVDDAGKDGEYAVEVFRDLASMERPATRARSLGGLISTNRVMLGIFELLPLVARSNSTVLISGESGTGKELVARAIYQLSKRSEGPFVTVNCAAIPDTLLESELFGYVRGAFTGADRDKPGRFAMADGGTIFLDEIAEVSPAIQAKLLRVLQDGVYQALGSTGEQQTDTRVLAATNRDIEAMMEKGEFRSDLYYRINVINIHLPPLRERMEDLPLLVEHFVSKFNSRENRSVQGVTDDALAALMSYDFPGNVRELENLVERAFVLCKRDRISTEHLPRKLTTGLPTAGGTGGLRELEASYIMSVLRRNDWNKTAAARELGIHKSTLYRKIKRLGLDVPRRGKKQ
ncbi:AAA domain-containing protein [Candidatus Fermentibacteria bacterium]|nr:AAA domain-containing protein [Candidatus Fermentibacteria bacterium]